MRPPALTRDRLAGLIVFLVAAIVYGLTLCPTIPFGDAGELAGVCYTLGIAHPTGYPLLTIIGWPWSHLPLPLEPVVRMNLFSALCTAASAAVFYATVLLLCRDRAKAIWGAAAAALGYAFARTVWDQATNFTVHSFQMLLWMVMLFFLVRGLLAERRERSFLLAGLFLGLCLTNHPSVLLSIPALLYLYFFACGFKRESWTLLAKVALAAGVPLLLYLYLPLRSSATFPFSLLGPPVFNRGATGDSWSYFWSHISGEGFYYATLKNDRIEQLQMGLHLLPQQFAWIGALPLLWGMGVLYKSHKMLLEFALLIPISTVLGAYFFGIRDIAPFYLQAFASLLLIAGVGLADLATRWRPIRGLGFAFPGALLVLNWSNVDQSDNYIQTDILMNRLRNMRARALIVSNQWPMFTSGFLYLQRIRGIRPDITVISAEYLIYFPSNTHQIAKRNPELVAGSERQIDDLEQTDPSNQDARYLRQVELISSIVRHNFGKRPIYFGNNVANAEPEAAGGYGLMPVGLARLVVDQSAPPPPDRTKYDWTRTLRAHIPADDPVRLEAIQKLEQSMQFQAQFLFNQHRDEEAKEVSSWAAKLLARVPAKPDEDESP